MAIALSTGMKRTNDSASERLIQVSTSMERTRRFLETSSMISQVLMEEIQIRHVPAPRQYVAWRVRIAYRDR